MMLKTSLSVYFQVKESFPYLLKNLRTQQRVDHISVMQEVLLLQPAIEREFK